MSLLSSFEDKSWGLLDGIHLGDFFEDHNIPPQVFPVIIIALVIVAFFMFFQLSGHAQSCGDRICQPSENCASCPHDCNCTVSSRCGNGVCEYALGEQQSCPQDCGLGNNGTPASPSGQQPGQPNQNNPPGQNPPQQGNLCMDNCTHTLNDPVKCAAKCNVPINSGQTQPNQKNSTPGQNNAAPSGSNLCGDGTCDDTEKASGKCPQDCG